MSHAIDVINPAIEKTKKLLFPFNLKFWLKLALIVFLVGLSSPGFNNRSFEAGKDDISLSPTVSILLISFVVLLILAGLLLFYASSIATFVLLDSVLRKKLKIMDGFKRYLKQGLQLFFFRLGLGIVVFIVMVLMILPGVLLFSGGVDNIWIFIPYIAVVIFGVIATIILIAVLNSFTVDFVVPLMYLRGKGILRGWSSLMKIIRKNKGQFLVYIVVKILLGMVGGLIGLFIALFFLILFGIPAILLFILFSLVGLEISLLSTLPLPIIVLLIALVIFFAVSISYIITFFTLPIPVFFRFYSILFLEKVCPDVSWSAKPNEPEKPKEKVKPSKYSVY